MPKTVFVTWSGNRALTLAEGLKKYVPAIVPGTVLFFSPDIGGGFVWLTRLLKELTIADFGIVCVSKENRDSRWLHFEVGALWQRAGREIPVCPLLLDLGLKQLKQPLAFFQARRFDEKGMYDLCRQLAEGTTLASDQLRINFSAIWPKLRREVSSGLKALPPVGSRRRPRRTAQSRRAARPLS